MATGVGFIVQQSENLSAFGLNFLQLSRPQTRPIWHSLFLHSKKKYKLYYKFCRYSLKSSIAWCYCVSSDSYLSQSPPPNPHLYFKLQHSASFGPARHSKRNCLYIYRSYIRKKQKKKYLLMPDIFINWGKCFFIFYESIYK